MIKIKLFAFGNEKESYYIDDFTEKINIIHSNDNNKGKTMVSQGIFYALGNSPIFPTGFENYNDYYYVVLLEIDEKKLYICRKNDNFVVNDGCIKSYESVNDFKRFFNAEICPLAIINENNHMVGLELFYELFFLPQDRRTSSNIINKGRYNKDDYYEMIYSYLNCINDIDLEEIEKNKNEIKKLEEQRKILVKSEEISKIKKTDASYISYIASKEKIDKKLKEIDKIKDQLSNLLSQKNRMLNKISKNEILIKEINSLNRELEIGKLKCGDCGSDKIVYETDESSFKFDITDLETRKQIKSIIDERILIAKENIVDLNAKINEKQNQISELMADEDISIENIIFYKEEIIDANKIDNQIYDIDKKIEELRKKIDSLNKENKDCKNTRQDILKKFIEYMKDFYYSAIPNDPIEINDIFTKGSVNYSGSQEAIFLMSRIYASSKMIKIDFPICIDHFRGGEISTFKENIILKKFNELNKQIILSCTLKEEENKKYNRNIEVNNISFDEYEEHHILNNKNNKKFYDLLNIFMIKIDLK